MRPINIHSGIVALLDCNDVDTDAILPKQFMMSVSRSGYGLHVFDEWKYLDPGTFGMDCSRRTLNPAFELNQPRYQGASILLSRRNFGCGSSREHAVWGLAECGFRIIVAESFADIFRTNCINNGLLPIQLGPAEITHLVTAVKKKPGYRLETWLEEQTIRTEEGILFRFSIPMADKTRLLRGYDAIEGSLLQRERIENFEKQRRERFPWLFGG